METNRGKGLSMETKEEKSTTEVHHILLHRIFLKASLSFSIQFDINDRDIKKVTRRPQQKLSRHNSQNRKRDKGHQGIS